MTAQQQHAHGLQDRRALLRLEGQQRAERDHPVHQEVQAERKHPGAARPLEVVADLLRDVAVPDQQVLANPDVRPEGGEREQQLPQIVKLLVTNDVLHQAPLAQQYGRQRHRGDALHEGPGEHEHREHRAEPLRVERDDEVVGRDREGPREQDDTDEKRFMRW